MTDRNTNRRNLLKTIAAGSGAVVAGKSLPESWSKPIVNSILLPAHALTTGCCEIAGTYCGLIGDERSIEITVDASGAITIVAETDKGEKNFTASVTCSGGSFTAIKEEDDHDHEESEIPVAAEEENGSGGGPTITGTVTCDSDSISGYFVSGGGQEKEYTADKAGCAT